MERRKNLRVYGPLLGTILFATAGCERPSGIVDFCYTTTPLWDMHRLEFVLDHNMIVATDAGSRPTIIETDDAIGFTEPFQLAIPKRPGLMSWTLGPVDFVAEQDGQALVIRANEGDSRGAIVHFHPKRGVTYICTGNSLLDCNENNWRVCGGQLDVAALQRMRAHVPDE